MKEKHLNESHWNEISDAFPLHKKFVNRSGRVFSVVAVQEKPTWEGYYLVTLMDCSNNFSIQLPSVYVDEMMDEL